MIDIAGIAINCKGKFYRFEWEKEQGIVYGPDS